MKKQNSLRKALFSMRTALILLLLLTAACILGSVIPQGNIESWYETNYPGNPARLLLLLGLDDVFHSPWFIALTALLCLNLLGCNLLRFPSIRRQGREDFTPERALRAWDAEAEAEVDDPEGLFARMGFRAVQSGTWEGRPCRYAARHRLGLWGAWLTHLGMLIIILGFALGQMFTVEYTVYGVPGTTKPVGDTGYTLTIDSFRVDLRADNTVEQYTAGLTMTAPDGSVKSGESSVNHPLSLFGMKLYQNSMGWAATVSVEKDGQPLQAGVLCAGEHLSVADKPELVVLFNSFYPDLVFDASGMPSSASPELRRPGYLYTIYYKGEVVGMNVLEGDEPITIDQYTVTFSDPREYTLITLKHDPFTPLALTGGLVLLSALFVAFYLRTEELWAIQQPDGKWAVAGRSRKGGVLFHDKLQNTAKERKP